MMKFQSYLAKLSTCYLFIGNTFASCSNFSHSLKMNETGTELGSTSRSQFSEKGFNNKNSNNSSNLEGRSCAKWVLGTILVSGTIASVACNIWQATENSKLNEDLNASYLQNAILQNKSNVLSTKLSLIDQELAILESTSAAFLMADADITGNDEYNYTNIPEIAMNNSLPGFYDSFTSSMYGIVSNCTQQANIAQIYCSTTANNMYTECQNSIIYAQNECQSSIDALTSNYNALSASIQNSDIACKTGYYIGSNNLCNQCAINNCATCANFSQTITTMTCNTCSIGYCLSSTNTCTQTSLTNCIACSNATNCTTCNSNQLFISSGSCVACNNATNGISNCNTCSITAQSTLACTSCDDGFFLNPAKTACQPCSTAITNCNICSIVNGSTTCNSCNNGFYLNNGACTACSTNCSTCTSSTVCSSCTNTNFLKRDMSGCDTCGNTITNCSTCASVGDSYTLCQSCSSGYFVNSDYTCTSCSDSNAGMANCATCLNGNYCLSCTSPNLLSPLRNSCGACNSVILNCSTCLAGSSVAFCTQCSNGYFLNSNFCNPCPTNCSTCTNAITCTSCKPGFTLTGGSCS